MSSKAAVLFCALSVVALAPAAGAETVYGITDTAPSNLFFFDSATPGSTTTVGPVTGLGAQILRGIDFRPADGLLYGVATTSATAAQLYTISTSTGVATPVGSGFALTGNTSSNLSIDFNPVADALRVVSSADWNGRVSTAGALLGQDTNLTAATAVTGVAYSNNVANATSTVLYAYDYNNDIVGTITPPNSGAFVGIGGSGFVADFTAMGFDISGATGIAYLADTSTVATDDEFRTVNLNTGATSIVGSFPSGTFVRDISVAPVPEPTALAVMAFGSVALLRRRK